MEIPRSILKSQTKKEIQWQPCIEKRKRWKQIWENWEVSERMQILEKKRKELQIEVNLCFQILENKKKIEEFLIWEMFFQEHEQERMEEMQSQNQTLQSDWTSVSEKEEEMRNKLLSTKYTKKQVKIIRNLIQGEIKEDIKNFIIKQFLLLQRRRSWKILWKSDDTFPIGDEFVGRSKTNMNGRTCKEFEIFQNQIDKTGRKKVQARRRRRDEKR